MLSSRIVRDPRTQGGAGNLSIGVNPTRVGAQRTPTNPSPAERAEPAEAAGAAGSCPVSYTSPAQCPLLQPPLSPGFCLRVDVREASPGWSLLPGVPGSITAKGRRQPVDVSVSHRCFSLPSFPSPLSKNQWKEDPGVRSRRAKPTRQQFVGRAEETLTETREGLTGVSWFLPVGWEQITGATCTQGCGCLS